MSKFELTEVIRRPIISEKSTRIADKHRQIAFEVMSSAPKNIIKKAVEKLFNVEVIDVNVLNANPKSKMFRQRKGVRKKIKKAYVTLKEGYDITFQS